ncbi:Cucumber peeling cupredoxin [Ananas comosus]|uniref:Cucumber peeling cupredoxin n=1 Tax=Ananas comosus TaxID=4615 RepID=A0A199V774_ANACO|nr:Cucumber peeling cupredoxin [Ananas comosus]
MRMRLRMMAAAAAAALSIILQGAAAAAATQHVVGGATGWTIPPNASFYSDWSSAQAITVGDTLLFNFTTGIHNVMPVGKAGYDGCSTQGTVGPTLTTGPATVTLKAPGAHYYICGVPTHCSFGQKLAVNVSAAAGPAPPRPRPRPRPGHRLRLPAGPPQKLPRRLRRPRHPRPHPPAPPPRPAAHLPPHLLPDPRCGCWRFYPQQQQQRQPAASRSTS